MTTLTDATVIRKLRKGAHIRRSPHGRTPVLLASRDYSMSDKQFNRLFDSGAITGTAIHTYASGVIWIASEGGAA